MGDRNVIQLVKGGHWHYWNQGSMMPICGEGEPEAGNGWPIKFTRTMTKEAPSYGQIKNFCPVCVQKEASSS